jgi:hypothetical protein
MARTKPTRADQLRRHRQIFLYAREHDLSLVEAEFALLREERAARLARRQAVQGCGRTLLPYQESWLLTAEDHPLRPLPENAPWMMRD